MRLQQLYTWAKTIHRWAMWIAILLGVPLALTGLALHKIVEGEGGFLPVDPMIVRWWHGQLSSPFALILAVMMVSGFLMWWVPRMLVWRARKNKTV